MKKVFLLLAAALALTCMACTGTVGGDKQNYTVTFQTNGADSINSKSVAEGSKVTEPDPAPQKTGYDFLGWYSDSSFTTKYDFNTAVTSDLTLYAKWQIQTFSVVFDTDGGSSVTTQTVEYDKTATKPADPTKDGFDFEGWYIDVKFTTEFSFDTKIKSDLKIFAKWTEKSQPNPEPEDPEQQQQQGGEEQQQPEEQQQQQGGEEQQQQQDPPPVVTYTVKFETNGGTAITQKTVTEGEAVARPLDPEREGYIFTGWYADEGLNTTYNFDTSVTAPVTIYAKWTIKTFTVNFVVQDAQTEVPPQQINYNGTVTQPSDPEKEGYNFGGWYADEGLNTTYNFDTSVTAPVTIYAKWTIKTFTVNFVVQNAQTEVPPQQINYNGTVTRPSDPEKEGYNFGGWYADEGLNTTYNFATSVTAPVTIYAKWTIKTFTVNFVVQNAQTEVPPQQINYNGTVTRPSEPEKEGYNFGGWYADEGLKTTYNFDTPVKATVTIYAKWTIKTFTVNFVVQDAQTEVPPQQINYNGTVTRPSDPEKEGYNFGGWYADEGLNTTYNFATSVTAPVTIYAKWTIKTFTVNFVVQDDPDSPIQITIPSQQINYNGTVTKPADPQQQGAEFRGWYSDSKFKTSYDFNTAVQADLTLYGHLYEFPIDDINYAAQQEKDDPLDPSPFPQTYPYPVYNWSANGSSQGLTIDGLGKFKATCDDIEYSVNVDGNRKIELKKLTITAPSALENITMGIKIHVENGTRNGTNAIETTEDILLSSTKEIITIQNTELNNYLNQKQQLYFEISYTFTYNNQNYEYLVFKNGNNKWYQDPGVITGFGKYPLVTIVSTANGGSNRFVTEPRSRHIKNKYWDSNIPDPYYVACKITAGNVVDAVADVKVRGNYTTSYAKKSLRIKFDKKQNMFGLNNGEKFKSWVLLSVFKDASLLRDVTAFKMFHEMFPDYYASDAQLVEVVLNGTYMGVYVLAEQQQTNKKRINISEAEKNSSETQIGYLLEFDKYYDTEERMNRFEIHYPEDIKDYEEQKLNDPLTGYTIKSDVYSLDQRNFIMNYMNNLWKICYEAAYNHKYYKFNYEYRLVEYTPEGATQDEKCQNCINRVIDTTSLANMYIFSEITCDPDLYWSSFYMDIDFAEGADKKLRFEAPWDFDSTMGNKRFSITGSDCSNEGINAMFAGKGQPDVNGDGSGHGNPWMVIFINQTWFKNLVKAQWATVNVAALKSSVSSFIDTNSSGEYTIAFELNRNKWGTPLNDSNAERELCADSKTAAQTSQAASAEYFKEWLMQRIDAVDNIINNILQ